MNKSEMYRATKGLGKNDYEISLKIFQKRSDGSYNWLFNFEGGGFNNVFAKTKVEAIKAAKAEYSTPVDPLSFRKATDESAAAQDELGLRMSM